MDDLFHREEGWPPNCLRHLFGSVRVAEIKNIAAVSLEMDNSPERDQGPLLGGHDGR
ncbi:hypothetical protein OJ996_10400 [Luteolibacter sp. GHJ8]|uniref:Uncharacterized protein n=1 Tax=Luteolibacter rhizosphaerae TaxID=2989719 RepID=A0ABT3G2C4_9BACT|nr:hypothetical protein [Luteolibacter rhizosphaerae]MCW1913987.1 hypothetical protein [Luteolibacter rhizosphaerae]